MEENVDKKDVYIYSFPITEENIEINELIIWIVFTEYINCTNWDFPWFLLETCQHEQEMKKENKVEVAQEE